VRRLFLASALAVIAAAGFAGSAAIAGTAPALDGTGSMLGMPAPGLAPAHLEQGEGGGGGGSVELPKALQGLKIGGVFFLSYAAGKANDQTYNQFDLKRGYFDVQKTITPFLAGRYTTDITRLGSGDFETRMKYLYGKFTFKAGSFLTQPNIEFGQGHAPYHDFWEAINGYRLQGTMFLERNGVMSSADVGAVFGSNLGGEMDADYKNRVNSHYAGKYGSLQAGVYNGGGYHAKELNENKVGEARLTVRPLPMQVPGLQVSVFGVDGKGNVARTPGMPLPDFKVVNAMLSYQSHLVTVTGEGYAGTGNQGGSAVDGSGRSRDQNGYSVFAGVRIPQHEAWGLMARYDHFDSDIHVSTNDEPDRIIAGVSYRMASGTMWLVDVERVNHSLSGMPDETQGELALQLQY
jgi:hypothetical protein